VKPKVRGLAAAVERGTRVFLRPPRLHDGDELLAVTRASRRVHRPWVQPPRSPQEYRRYLRRVRGDGARGFLVCRRDDGAIVGVINLNEIVRKALQSAYLGYYVGASFAGRGYMTDGLRLVLRHAFTKLKLHRLEANIQPQNRASIALAHRCGLRREGFSPRYLKVSGRWRDHQRWAITVEDWRQSR